MKPISLLLLTFTLFCPLSSSTPLTNFFTTKAGDNATLMTIEQPVKLNKCRVKVSDQALYLCEDKAYLFSNKWHPVKFAEVLKEIPAAVEGDVNVGTAIVMTPGRLQLILNMEYTVRETGEDFKNEVPILAKLKRKDTYMLTVEMFRPVTPLDPKQENIASDTVSNSSHVYVMRSILLGKASHIHKTRFPSEDLDFTVTDSSFRQAEMYTDPYYQNEYLFIVLERGWLYVFKYMFEDPSMELIQTQTLKDGYEIQEIAVADTLLFSLFKSNSTSDNTQLILQIYRIIPVDGFELRTECSITIPIPIPINTTQPASYQLRVKNILNTFLVLINFPGSQILIYSFQKPTTGFFSLTCPTTPYELNYNTADQGSQIGYSFDYIVPDTEKLSDHGILLSPLGQDLTHSHFIPYCMPNYYLTSDFHCMACRKGYSQGGLTTTCQSCDELVDQSHELIPGQDPMREVCPMACQNHTTFGKHCQNCSEYMASTGVTLPIGISWGVDSQGACGLKCRDGTYANADLGMCLDGTQQKIINDSCAQVTDCLNCSLTESCGWCLDSCKTFHKCNPRKEEKQHALADYFVPSIRCNLDEACGTRMEKGAAGNFSFKSDMVYKNQLCLWSFESKYSGSVELRLTPHLDGLENNPWSNVPNLFINRCYDRIYGADCVTTPYELKDGEPILLNASRITLFAWAEESILVNATQFRLEYTLTPFSNLMDGMYIFLRFISHFLFICIILNCIIASRQQFRAMHRRRRLMQQLRSLELWRLVENMEQRENVEQQEHHAIDAEEVMDNDRIVNRIVYDSQNNAFGQTECPICLDAFRDQEPLARLACQHLYHIHCFTDWVKAVERNQQLKCPVCNRVFE